MCRRCQRLRRVRAYSQASSIKLEFLIPHLVETYYNWNPDQALIHQNFNFLYFLGETGTKSEG